MADLVNTRPADALNMSGRHVSRRSWQPFVVVSAIALVYAGALTIWFGFNLGGRTVTNDASDIGEVFPALAAAATCVWASRTSTGRMRWAWLLLGTSAAAWGLGEVAWCVYEVGLGILNPFPSAADIGYLVAIPLAVGGVLALPTAATRRITLGRTLLDGSTVALSLLLVSWTLGLGQIYRQSGSDWISQAIGLAYPIGDILILTALFIAFRRSDSSMRGPVLLLMGGLAANAFSDSTFALLNANGTYVSSNQLLNCGWVYGYILIMLAPLWPHTAGEKAREEGPISLWRMMLPWIGLIAVLITAAVFVVTGRSLDPFLLIPSGLLIGILFISQAFAYRDSLGLLVRSKIAEAQVRQREEILNEVIDHAPQGVARITVDRRIANANPRLAAMFSIPLSQMVGSPLDRLVPAEVVSAAQAELQGQSASRETFGAERQATAEDGRTFWLHWSLTAVRRPNGKVESYIAMFDDITKEHEAEEIAQANLNQLETLSRLKSEFMSMATHEFRSALVGIQGFSEMIRDTDLEEAEIKSMADDINKESLRVNRMLTEMLDLDRLEAGKIRLELKPTNFNEIVEDAVDRAQVSTRKHHIIAVLEPDLPAVSADADRLTEVLSNLLTNAIKYSPDGGDIEVTTRLAGGSVEVSVKDHGLGIPPEFIGKLFGRYERFENKGAGKIIGTGLGLAITRQIVEMHGGRIGVESTQGMGSDFKFTIPVPVSTTAQAGRS